MGQLKPNLAMMAILLMIGVATLTHFIGMIGSEVRSVVIIGIAGGGAACGAAVFGVAWAIATRKKS